MYRKILFLKTSVIYIFKKYAYFYDLYYMLKLIKYLDIFITIYITYHLFFTMKYHTYIYNNNRFNKNNNDLMYFK